jgi:predicted metal-dependent peptidase
MDISGSIMQKECDAFVAQINSMRIESPAEKITIVPFNSVIQWDDIVEVYEDDEVPNRFNVGGGTNFRSITSWTRRQDEMPDALIIFTDLGSRSYGEEPDCPVMWASSYPVFDSPGYTNRPPFGEVIEIEI